MSHDRSRSARRAALASLVAVVLVLPGWAAALPRVVAEVGPTSMLTLKQDAIDDTPRDWLNAWGLSATNYGPGLFSRPRVTLQTPMNFMGFMPDDPGVFTAQPSLGTYTWDYGSLEVAEGYFVAMSGKQATSTAAPGFSASRTVDPSRLLGTVTTQTVTVNVRFEDALPEGTNLVTVGIGQPAMAYGGHSLVASTFVTQNPTPDWISTGGVTAAGWLADTSLLKIGVTYRFQATIRITRLQQIAGSPLCVPGATIGMRRIDKGPEATSTLLAFTHPDGPTGTFEATSPVNWQTNYVRYNRIFWFGERVSPVASTVTLKASSALRRPGQVVTISGRVSPGSGRIARLQERIRGVWKTRSQQPVKNGAFTFKRAEKTAGLRMYRVFVPASAFAPSVASRPLSIRWR